ncbi:hypothetical protein TYRP_012342, partial [Tyrophagus putrescentiae]
SQKKAMRLITVFLLLLFNFENFLLHRTSAEPCSAAFNAAILARHNYYRALHSSTPPLTLNSSLNSQAQQWAEQILATGVFRHRPNRRLSENLFRQISETEVSAKTVVDAWYSESEFYGKFYGREPDLATFSSWRYFTAMIWASSRELGVGCATKLLENDASNSQSRITYVVTNYSPRGNVVREFAENVRRPRVKTTTTSTTTTAYSTTYKSTSKTSYSTSTSTSKPPYRKPSPKPPSYPLLSNYYRPPLPPPPPPPQYPSIFSHEDLMDLHEAVYLQRPRPILRPPVHLNIDDLRDLQNNQVKAQNTYQQQPFFRPSFYRPVYRPVTSAQRVIYKHQMQEQQQNQKKKKVKSVEEADNIEEKHQFHQLQPFTEELLRGHNYLRAHHGTAHLTLNASISKWSQSWADYLLTSGTFQHRFAAENLFYQVTSDHQYRLPGDLPVTNWYNELLNYPFFGTEPNLVTFPHWKHFTAMLWAASTDLGVGCSTTVVVDGYGQASRVTLVVVNYWPEGNVVGGFAENHPQQILGQNLQQQNPQPNPQNPPQYSSNSQYPQNSPQNSPQPNPPQPNPPQQYPSNSQYPQNPPQQNPNPPPSQYPQPNPQPPEYLNIQSEQNPPEYLSNPSYPITYYKPPPQQQNYPITTPKPTTTTTTPYTTTTTTTKRTTRKPYQVVKSSRKPPNYLPVLPVKPIISAAISGAGAAAASYQHPSVPDLQDIYELEEVFSDFGDDDRKKSGGGGGSKKNSEERSSSQLKSKAPIARKAETEAKSLPFPLLNRWK